MFVIDNFLPFYDDVLIRSKLHKYVNAVEYRALTATQDLFRGERTVNLVNIAGRLQQYIENSLHIRLSLLFIHRHPPLPGITGRMHRDEGFQTAGVIYLKGGPGCGTVVEDKLVDFKENRLITYDAKKLHAPEGFTTDRLVITFFSYDTLPETLPN